jgi:hypothetical protein
VISLTGTLAPSQSASPAVESDRLAAPPASGTTTSAPVSTPDVLAAGALAIIHAAPATALAAREIPADSVGGFVYTGGSLQLADLKDQGVRYTGLTGVEWQGWLRAKETGRYELDLEAWFGRGRFGLHMPRGNRRLVMVGFCFEGDSVGRRPTSPGQAWRG